MNVDVVGSGIRSSISIVYICGCFDHSDVYEGINLPMDLDTSSCPIDLVVEDVEDTTRGLWHVLLEVWK